MKNESLDNLNKIIKFNYENKIKLLIFRIK